MNYVTLIELTNENAKIPTYAHESDAGADVYLPDDVVLLPNETKVIDLGFRLVIPENFEFQVRPRSGMSKKTKIRIPNSPGTIDSGYRNDVKILLENTGSSAIKLYRHDRVGQLILKPIYQAKFKKVSKVDENTDRGLTGFGDSGR
jgi:dUTP pyrophosphatase